MYHGAALSVLRAEQIGVALFTAFVAGVAWYRGTPAPLLLRSALAGLVPGANCGGRDGEALVRQLSAAGWASSVA